VGRQRPFGVHLVRASVRQVPLDDGGCRLHERCYKVMSATIRGMSSTVSNPARRHKGAQSMLLPLLERKRCRRLRRTPIRLSGAAY
jgi:hypothetical protein